MPRSYQLPVTTEQRQELLHLRDRAPQPYVRERAAVLLAIADGASIRQAAVRAGLRAHDADTVCLWVARYQAEGVAGLVIRKGRGRKPRSFRERPDAGRRACAHAGGAASLAAPL